MIYAVEGHYLRSCEEITTVYFVRADNEKEAEEKVRQYDIKSPVADKTNYFVRATFYDNADIVVAYEDWRDL